MSSEDEPGKPAEAAAVTDEGELKPLRSSRILAVGDAALPAPLDPETLVQGFRYLQQRIPGFRQLTVSEKRSMTNVAHLDPEFIAAVLHGAEVWDVTGKIADMTPAALRAEAEALDRMEDARRELQALLEGLDGAILRRRHSLGITLLQIYSMIGTLVRGGDPRSEHLRPYLENMKRAYRRRQKKSRKAAKKTGEPETPEE